MQLYKTLKVASCILFSCVLFLVLSLVSISSFGSKLSLDPSKELQMQARSTKELRMQARFLYLLQTESCIPKHLNTAETIGNNSTCQCDILVLSFKSVCKISGPPHIEYIFNSSSTWAAGRNLLYEVSRQRSEKYLYYIFMDDDIFLQIKVPRSTKNPWRLFENFLMRIQPAVGVVDGSGCQYLPHIFEARKHLGCKLENKAEYVPTPRFDAAFNAFHYNAVDYILPYSQKFDSISWWYPVVYAEIKTEIIFQGHSVIHTGLLADNRLHRPYKRKAPIDRHLMNIIDEVRAELPIKYQNASLLLEWRKDVKGEIHKQQSSTICLPPPPPHMPIKPFRTLELEATPRA